MGCAVDEHIEAAAGVFHAFSGVGGGEVVRGLASEGFAYECDGLAETVKEQRFRMSLGVTELEWTVADIAGAGDFRADVVVQVASEMQKQMSDAVAVGIRSSPDLIVRKRFEQTEDGVSFVMVEACEFGDDGGVEVRHAKNSVAEMSAGSNRGILERQFRRRGESDFCH